MIKKRGERYVVVHGHARKKGSKTDKPEGSTIGTHGTYAEALAQHQAIMASKRRRRRRRR